jgi:Tfp pilus assembly protein FimT
MQTTGYKSCFSLIELLSVMAISVVLIGISVPAFHTLMKGQNVEIAARTTGSQLKAIRSYAITNRTYAALIIPTTQDLPSTYLYKTFRPCTVNSNNVFQKWIYGERWDFLPTGTAILDVDNNSGYDAGNFTAASTITGIDFSDIGGTTDSAKGIVFTPVGKSSGSRKFVVVGDSLVLEDGIDSTSNQIDITIDTYTGRISYGSE